ncbi:MbtH family protein [Pseudomonas lactis]|uniref:MbtH family protein n=1 Tax=Pseudomonas lactis TaxID=1615674 RepID=UPI000B62C8FF|nr:MbtH family protein [Pseudomonas lactis]
MVNRMDAGWVVVINHEEQYSVYRADLPVPAGWVATGHSGTRDECLDHIALVWVDMRPRSVREALAKVASHSE